MGSLDASSRIRTLVHRRAAFSAASSVEIAQMVRRAAILLWACAIGLVQRPTASDWLSRRLSSSLLALIAPKPLANLSAPAAWTSAHRRLMHALPHPIAPLHRTAPWPVHAVTTRACSSVQPQAHPSRLCPWLSASIPTAAPPVWPCDLRETS